MKHLFLISLCSLIGHAATPTLVMAKSYVGTSNGLTGRASDFEFQMDPSGFPRAVTAGEAVFLFGSSPSTNIPTITDDKSNTWASAVSCTDAGSPTMDHRISYAVNAAAGTHQIKAAFSSAVGDNVEDWAHFYNMSTTASGFVDGSSCTTGITPANNTAPNISGTAYTTGTSGDLILTCVYIEGSPGQVLNNPNAITSVTYPSGFTGLSSETWAGHACAYEVQSSAGSFTPTFTMAQSTHSSFTIVSAAFKSGTGGSAPGSGASIILGELHFTSSTATNTLNLPCPTNTTAIIVVDDAQGLSATGAVTDSGSSTWVENDLGAGVGKGPIVYTTNPVISSTNSYTITLAMGRSGGFDLLGLYCLVGTGAIDSNLTAQNTSTLCSANSGCASSGQNGATDPEVDLPTVTTSAPGDLIIQVGAFGTGPANDCVAGQCVFDYVASTSWNGTMADNQSYSNGDMAAHQYASTASQVEFEVHITNGQGVSAGNGMSQAFLAAPILSRGTSLRKRKERAFE